VNFSLNEPTPTVFASFQVENHSGVDLVLDRVITEVWAGQPVAYGVMAYRTRIPKHTTAGQIPSLRIALTEPAIEKVKSHREQQQPITYNLYGTAFFDCKLGSFEVQLVGHEAEVAG